MPDSYAYDGGSWRGPLSEWWVYDGGTWRECTEVWSYDGAAWRKVFEVSSCEDATCDSASATWGQAYGRFCSNCASGYCMYCMRLYWGLCDDACHHVDGQLSTNGGSYLTSLACFGKACANDSACDCSGDFACELGKTCLDDDDTYIGRLQIQRDADHSVDCVLYGASKSGICVA